MIRLAIIGTGGMAQSQAQCFQKIKGCRIVAACDVMPDKVRAFAEKFEIPQAFTDVDDLLKRVPLDAVSIVTPDRFHAPLALKAIASGRHVLCEKPLATNYRDARRMVDAARRRGVIHMINFTYRNVAALHHAAKLVREGAIGRVLHVEASYLQSWLSAKYWGDWRSNPTWLWRLSTRHGSQGVLGDIGVHILDFATWPAGSVRTVHCRLKTFRKAKGDRMGEYHLDANDSAAITLELSSGALGVIHMSRWGTGYRNTIQLTIHGDLGALRINTDKSYEEIEVCLGRDIDKTAWKTIKLRKATSNYQRFIRSIRTGRNDQPDFVRGAEVQKILDACFDSARTGRIVKVCD